MKPYIITVNSIIILMLAITLLAFGLTYVQNIMKKSTDKIDMAIKGVKEMNCSLWLCADGTASKDNFGSCYGKCVESNPCQCECNYLLGGLVNVSIGLENGEIMRIE